MVPGDEELYLQYDGGGEGEGRYVIFYAMQIAK
jgi:hypothetical protein